MKFWNYTDYEFDYKLCITHCL